MCDWKVFTVMLVVDQLTIFVESSPVPLVAHPNKFIGIGILIVYAPFNVSEFWVSYTHCLTANSNPVSPKSIRPVDSSPINLKLTKFVSVRSQDQRILIHVHVVSYHYKRLRT